MHLRTTIQVWRDPETGQFIARATPLDVASSGPTARAAKLALAEATRLMLDGDDADVAATLEESGYVRDGDGWAGPEVVETGTVSIDLGVAV